MKIGNNGGPCSYCDVNTYKTVSGPSSCQPCGSNRNSPQASTLQTQCLCNPGTTGDDGITTCTLCSLGYYKSTSGTTLFRIDQL
jgi:hypothetical protein